MPPSCHLSTNNTWIIPWHRYYYTTNHLKDSATFFLSFPLRICLHLTVGFDTIGHTFNLAFTKRLFNLYLFTTDAVTVITGLESVTPKPGFPPLTCIFRALFGQGFSPRYILSAFQA